MTGVHEMSRSWFDQEARLGLRLICQYWTHPNVQPRALHITGLEFSNTRDMDLFIRDVPRSSPERDYEDIRAPMFNFESWEAAQDWMRSA